MNGSTRLLLVAVILAVAGILVSCDKQDKTSGGASEVMTIRIPLVTWGGYADLFAANGGAAATEDSLFYKYGKFKVELIQEENPANQLQGFANGTYQIIWSTMDMLPINYEALAKDTRTIPKVIGLFDYSAGGDGIIVRGGLKDAASLKGKKIVAAQYSPSHFFLLHYLSTAGLVQSDCTVIFVADAITAKDTFINDTSIDACVTWSPFIYDITDPAKVTYVKGSTLLTSSLPGTSVHGLIADVYLTSADMVAKHPEVIEAFTKAMIEGHQLFLKNQDKVAADIAQLFGIKGGAEEVKLMFNDVIIAGKSENRAFFGAAGSVPIQADATAAGIFKLASELYRKNDTDLAPHLVGDANQVLYSAAMLKASAD